MKMFRSVAVAGFLLASVLPAAAQWQTQNHSVPLGRGNGVTGFGAAVPSTAGVPLVSQGASADPAFSPVTDNGILSGGADTYKGSLNGSNTVDVAFPPCSGNKALQYTSGSGPTCATIAALTGFDQPTNIGLAAGAAGNALTISLTAANGSALSSTNAAIALFRSPFSLPAGTAVQATVTAPLSITIPSGATLGTSNGVPFRIWVFLDFNGGTPALGVATCSNASTLFPCASWEYALRTSTTINASATNPGVLYAGTGVAADAVRIIGYCEYGSGLTTAGVWASSCTALQLFGPGIKKPGDQVQRSLTPVTAQTTISGSAFVTTALVQSMTPTSTANPIYATADVAFTVASGGTAIGFIQLCRTSASNLFGTQQAVNNTAAGSSLAVGATVRGYDLPNSLAAVNYFACIKNQTGNVTLNGQAGQQSTIELQEIMG
jgi:hypothetical protein